MPDEVTKEEVKERKKILPFIGSQKPRFLPEACGNDDVGALLLLETYGLVRQTSYPTLVPTLAHGLISNAVSAAEMISDTVIALKTIA